MSTTSVGTSGVRIGLRPRVLRVRLTLMGFGAILAGAAIGTGIAHWPVIS